MGGSSLFAGISLSGNRLVLACRGRVTIVKRLGFRGRLFLILLGFALVPTIIISLAWSMRGSIVLPYFGNATAAWDSVAATGERAIDVARAKPLAPPERQLI